MIFKCRWIHSRPIGWCFFLSSLLFRSFFDFFFFHSTSSSSPDFVAARLLSGACVRVCVCAKYRISRSFGVPYTRLQNSSVSNWLDRLQRVRCTLDEVVKKQNKRTRRCDTQTMHRFMKLTLRLRLNEKKNSAWCGCLVKIAGDEINLASSTAAHCDNWCACSG